MLYEVVPAAPLNSTMKYSHVPRKPNARDVHTPPPTLLCKPATCTVKPYATCNPNYGASVGRDSFALKLDVRMTITERIHLNDVGQQCLVMDRARSTLEVWSYARVRKARFAFKCKLSSVVCKLFLKTTTIPFTYIFYRSQH